MKNYADRGGCYPPRPKAFEMETCFQTQFKLAVFRLTGRLDGKKGIKELRKFQTKRINTLLKKKVGNSCFADAYKLNTDLRSNRFISILNKRQSNNYMKLISKPSSCRELVTQKKLAHIVDQPVPSPFQALRQWRKRERKGHAKSWRGGKKEKEGRESL